VAGDDSYAEGDPGRSKPMKGIRKTRVSVLRISEAFRKKDAYIRNIESLLKEGETILSNIYRKRAGRSSAPTIFFCFEYFNAWRKGV